MTELRIVDSTLEQPVMKLNGINEEIMRFERNGDIYIHGKLVTNNIQVVEGFRKFLAEHGYW